MAKKKITFGEIVGIAEGHIFKNRQEMTDLGVHRSNMQGIDGNREEGCASIVLSGGYEDQDFGNVIIYTGHGGYDINKKKQVDHQSWSKTGNTGLLISELHGFPVRVTRGSNHDSPFSPASGYQYGGLYRVTEHFYEIGSEKFGLCRFRLEKLPAINNEVSSKDEIFVVNESDGVTSRIPVLILRIVRDTKLSKRIKEMYNYTCQVCGLRIEFNGVGYAEAAHIRPLGAPHNGKDLLSNLLCLCPNHHVMFDKGCFKIDNNFSIVGLKNESLRFHKDHELDLDNVIYHSDLFPELIRL